MTRLLDRRCILAIEPTSRGLAFVLFEGGLVIDWGTRRDNQRPIEIAHRLLTHFTADLLVIENPDARGCKRRNRVRRLLRDLANSARHRNIATLLVSRDEVRMAWMRVGATAKHAVAAAIGRMFPEVEYLIPPPRKTYASEYARGEIFDAMSLVVHAVGVCAEPTNEREAA